MNISLRYNARVTLAGDNGQQAGRNGSFRRIRSALQARNHWLSADERDKRMICTLPNMHKS